MVYLPSDRRVPTTDEASPPSAAEYARALLDPIVETWRRQYATISTHSVRRAQPHLDCAASADFLTASAVRLAERIEGVRHCLNATLRPCLDTPPLHDSLDGIRAAVLKVRKAFDALLDWEREIRSVQVDQSLAKVQGRFLGASAFVVDKAIRVVDRWIGDVQTGSASTHTPHMVLDAPPRLTAALAELRDSVRARATINCFAWLIAAVAILCVILSW